MNPLVLVHSRHGSSVSLSGWLLSCSSSQAGYVAVARCPSLTSNVAIVTILAVKMGFDYDYGNCLSSPVQYHQCYIL